MAASGLLEDLIESLRCLPGVGPKSAQRMALHLLRRDRAAARQLGETLVKAMDGIRHCELCRIFTEQTQCRWCSDPARLSSQLCIVENQAESNGRGAGYCPLYRRYSRASSSASVANCPRSAGRQRTGIC